MLLFWYNGLPMISGKGDVEGSIIEAMELQKRSFSPGPVWKKHSLFVFQDNVPLEIPRLQGDGPASLG